MLSKSLPDLGLVSGSKTGRVDRAQLLVDCLGFPTRRCQSSRSSRLRWQVYAMAAEPNQIRRSEVPDERFSQTRLVVMEFLAT